MATSAKSKAPSTDVALKQSGEISPFAQESVPAYLQSDAPARGSEEVGTKDLSLPRLEIVQSQSPIKEENEDVREGELFNSVTQEVYGDSVYFIPVYYKMEYLLWQHKDAGGGFHGSFPTEDEANVKFKSLIKEDPQLAGQTKKGAPILEVVDTPVHYGLMIDPVTQKTEQIVISMARTKAKVSRKWNSLVQLSGGDRFSRVYRLSTFTDQNKQGDKFKNFVVQPAGFSPEAAYREAERLYEAFRVGAMQVNHGSVIDAEDDDRPNGDGIDRGGI